MMLACGWDSARCISVFSLTDLLPPLQARDTSVSDAIGASPPGSRGGSRSLSRAAGGALPLDRHSSSTTASGEPWLPCLHCYSMHDHSEGFGSAATLLQTVMDLLDEYLQNECAVIACELTATCVTSHDLYPACAGLAELLVPGQVLVA